MGRRSVNNGEEAGEKRFAIQSIPTTHTLYREDCRQIIFLAPNGLHLALTSPPYWNLNPYNGGRGQLGIIKDYEAFLDELDKVWQQALVLGGCLVCVVGDV